MYSVNGVPLDNLTMGWKLRAASKPLAGLVRELSSVSVPGRHGAVGLPPTHGPVPIIIVVQTPRANLEALYALFSRPTVKLTLTAAPTREAVVTLAGADYEGYGDADAFIDVKLTLRLEEGFSRAITESTSAPAALGSASVVASVMAGLSAPVQDATVRVKGPVTGLRVTDEGGSWWAYAPSIPSGTSILFTGGAAVLSTFPDANWDDYTSDVSGVVDFGGPLGVFELTPHFTTDPTVRSARLTVTTTARGAGAQISVRGKAAYLV